MIQLLMFLGPPENLVLQNWRWIRSSQSFSVLLSTYNDVVHADAADVDVAADFDVAADVDVAADIDVAADVDVDADIDVAVDVDVAADVDVATDVDVPG